MEHNIALNIEPISPMPLMAKPELSARELKLISDALSMAYQLVSMEYDLACHYSALHAKIDATRRNLIRRDTIA